VQYLLAYVISKGAHHGVESLSYKPAGPAGSFPDGVIKIFHCVIPSDHTVTLGSTRHLTEVITSDISWGGKGGRCVGLTPLPPICADCLEQCFSNDGPRPGTVPWHQLHRTARGSPGIDNYFKCNFISVNMPHHTHNCSNTLYDYAIINY